MKNNKESSETIPAGSTLDTDRGEKVALFKFYVLIDPRDGVIKYVGRTVDENNRYRNHIYEAKKNNRNKRERWIVYLLRKNMKPEMRVIYQIECNIAEAVKTEKALVKCLRRKGYPLKNSPDNYLGACFTGKTVYQYSTEDGSLIGSFVNANQAYIETGIKDSNIGRCCKNENGYGTKTAGGYFWSYIPYKKYPYKYISKWREIKGKPVNQYDLKGDFIETFNTARIASKATGISYKKVSAACNGRQHTAGGFVWKFKR